MSSRLMFFFILFVINESHGKICQRWSKAEVMGKITLEVNLIEHSGIDQSRKIEDRIYHITDSSKKLSFFHSQKNGKKMKKVKVMDSSLERRVRVSDLEDISVGSCFDFVESETGDCIFIADIGGKKRMKRNRLRLVVVPEYQSFPNKVFAAQILAFEYPNGWELDAEGFSIHPKTGDLYLITKSLHHDTETSEPAKVFRLSRRDWQTSVRGFSPKMSYLGEIDTDKFARTGVRRRYMYKAITGMDISSSGKSVIVSTYRDLYEMEVDFSKADQKDFDQLQIDQNVRRIELEKPFRLVQQESICYQEGSTPAIMYTSEFAPGARGNASVPIVGLECLD